ncbi:MAG: hypothetical protein EOM28_11330 [Clostridia bacterium]|nr:hypothetical protein [Clostridia bacterium]
MTDYTKYLLEETYQLPHHELSHLESDGDVDFHISVSDFARLKANSYQQRRSLSVVLRMGICQEQRTRFYGQSLMQIGFKREQNR